MHKPNLIKAAEEKIRKSAEILKKKYNRSNVITTEALTGIYFELMPGVEEIHAELTDLKEIVSSLGIKVISATELDNAPGDVYRVI